MARQALEKKILSVTPMYVHVYIYYNGMKGGSVSMLRLNEYTPSHTYIIIRYNICNAALCTSATKKCDIKIRDCSKSARHF